MSEAAKFGTGRVLATPGAMDALEAAGQTIYPLLRRHVTGDWGDLDMQDKRDNDLAVRQKDRRILSAYTLKSGVKVWLITEWDRSATTLLLPDEY
jgi:hypothetical protein